MGIIKNLVLHVHSDQSIKDGAQTPSEIVSRVKELGGSAVTLTDHGVLTGVFEFMAACKKEGIKGIPGVEAYIKEDDSDERRHLIILAKDAQGYKAIEKVVSESYTRIVELRTKSIPTMNKNILKKWFGPDSVGHNHVIATSACVQGVVASELTYNNSLQSAIIKANKQKTKYSIPNNLDYIQKVHTQDEVEKRIKELSEEMKALKKDASTPYKKAENYMQKRVGQPDYDDAKRAYDNIIEKRNAAAEKCASVKDVLTDAKKQLTRVRAEVKKYREDFKKYEKYDDIIKDAESKIKADKELISNAISEAEWYRELFGNSNFYMELQYHGGPNEDYVFPRLLMIAKKLGIPCVPANDAHYNTKNDYRRREMIVKDSFKSILDKIEPWDRELYIKTDDELKEALMNIIPVADIDKAFDNLNLITDSCNVVLPKEKHYPVYKGLPEGETAKSYIRKLAIAGIEKRYPGGVAPDGTKWDQEHIGRMENELEIISNMGFDNYHLVVQDYLNYGRQLGFDCPEGVGYTIGPGRGSAVGSLVCYLLGITDLDPIKYNLFFERYLNPERISMPDIDADFANCIRDKVIDYERSLYGEEGVCGVTTKGTLKIKAAILLAGRVNPETHDDINRVRAISKAVPKDAKYFNDPVNRSDPSQGTVKDFLLRKFEKYPVECQIIEDAASIEGLTVSFGRHAAAVILSDTGDVSDQVALMYTKGNWAVQCVKEEAEADVGVLKMDFLGLINLDIITETIRKVFRNYNIKIDMNKDVKFEPEVFKNIFSTGNTDAVFQFASQGMKQMLKDFMPSSFEDLILLVAAYRPGPMQYLADIIAVKHGRKKASYSIPELKPILSTTYGKTVYQEQVQEIFKHLAGYSLGQADLVRRAMSKKKLKELEKEREAFLHGDKTRNIKGCAANGINEFEANKLFDEMMNFASYAFNKSHAAAYAYVAYQTAWLKYHYPTEYMASVMEMSKYDKIPMYIYDAKNMGLKIRMPDINESTLGFTAEKDSILFGFKAMKGVGNVDIEEILNERKKGKYSSFKNFLKRTNISKTSFENLLYGGAFDCFNSNRKALLEYGVKLRELKKKYSDTLEKYNTVKDAITDDSGKKEKTKLANLEEMLKTLNEDINNLMVVNCYEDKIDKMTREREVLGSFISDHPVNNYRIDVNTTKIKDIKAGDDITICGLITDYKKLVTKKKGEEFCTFSLDDGTGTINAVVFPALYQNIFMHLRENTVICLKGKVRQEEIRQNSLSADDDSDDEENETVDYVYKFYPDSIGGELRKKQFSVILNLKTAAEWALISDRILGTHESHNGEGLNLFIYDQTYCELRYTNKMVKSSILRDETLSIEKSNYEL